jgi:hypothetical protein
MEVLEMLLDDEEEEAEMAAPFAISQNGRR